MITIPVNVCGDTWVNPEEVLKKLQESDTDQYICLNFQFEGPSIKAIGLLEMLESICNSTGRKKETILISKNPNTVEKTSYHNNTSSPSHFFSMSKNYWTDPGPAITEAKLLGYFVGRRTISRAVMLHDLWHGFHEKCLFSLMDTVLPDPWIHPSIGFNLETWQEWMSQTKFEQFCSWFQNCPVKSIDSHSVRDQYDKNQNTNFDLLKFYNQFRIELVAESYTRGNTFFPTEKTVRPIMAAKPFIVYGPCNYLARLRELGFKTYDSCWDESYDQYEGPARWQAMKQLIASNPVPDLKIAEYNREHLKSLI